MDEPPNKKIKGGQEFVELIQECYDLKFNGTASQNEDEQNKLLNGIKKIRETLENASSSSDVSFGSSKTYAKINWGKCLGILIEDGINSLKAIRVLTEKLSPGGGLL